VAVSLLLTEELHPDRAGRSSRALQARPVDASVMVTTCD